MIYSYPIRSSVNINRRCKVFKNVIHDLDEQQYMDQLNKKKDLKGRSPCGATYFYYVRMAEALGLWNFLLLLEHRQSLRH